MRLKILILPIFKIACLVAVVSAPYSGAATANDEVAVVKERASEANHKVDPFTAGVRKHSESVEEQASGAAPVLEPFLIMMLGWVLLSVSAGIKLLVSRARRPDQSAGNESIDGGVASEGANTRYRKERDQ